MTMIVTYNWHAQEPSFERDIMTISEHEYEINSMKSALERRVETLRDNILFSDVEILTKTKTYYAHKLVLSARSSDWGRGQDLSSAVLDWRNFRDKLVKTNELPLY